ncbi:MAG: hypothetical protein G01um101431_979 [Parcubacteria group bacterium Gr01-1014_31]|nr:MAG: hypothetical protein G01um101431_979 [Parcubacteria group bacterium Gr01-1014_31]
MVRLQRALLIVTFVLVTIMLGVLLYAVFFGGGFSDLGGNEQVGGSGSAIYGNQEVPIGGGGQLPAGRPSPSPSASPVRQPSPAASVASGGTTVTQRVVDVDAQQLTLDRDGVSVLYYNPTDGRFYRLTSRGTVETLDDRVFHNVERITWSDDRQRAVLEYPDGANIVYDFSTDRQTTLPKHWEAFDFAPDGEQLIAKSIGLDTENRWLVVTDASGSRTRPIVALGENADTVIPSWSPNGQMVAMQVETSGEQRQEVFFIGQNDERFPSAQVPGWGFEAEWTPSGNQLLYSVYSSRSGNRPELWLSDATPSSVGTNRLSVGLQTWAHKCTFSSPSVAYCAVPSELPSGAGLFPNEMDAGVDSVYRVDLASGATSLVGTPDQPHTMGNLLVSSDGRSLYYTAKQDGSVYRLQLK